ncbi:hypothetical protein D3C72_131650 [compost metagenome]
MSSPSAPLPWLPALLVGALGAVDLLTGLAMMVAPEGFAMASGLPVGVPGITQGYGQRIALFGLVYLLLAVRMHQGDAQAKRWLVLPFMDEALNVILNVQLLATGALPAAALMPMLGVHTFFAMGLAGVLLLGKLAQRQNA